MMINDIFWLIQKMSYENAAVVHRESHHVLCKKLLYTADDMDILIKLH